MRIGDFIVGAVRGTMLASAFVEAAEPTDMHAFEWSNRSEMSLIDACHARPDSLFVLSGYNDGPDPLVDYGPLCLGKLIDSLKCDWLTLQIVECKLHSPMLVNVSRHKQCGDVECAIEYGTRVRNVFSRPRSAVHTKPFHGIWFDSAVWRMMSPANFLTAAISEFGASSLPIELSIEVDVLDFSVITDDFRPSWLFIDFTSLLSFSHYSGVRDIIRLWRNRQERPGFKGWFITFGGSEAQSAAIENFFLEFGPHLSDDGKFKGRYFRETQWDSTTLGSASFREKYANPPWESQV